MNIDNKMVRAAVLLMVKLLLQNETSEKGDTCKLQLTGRKSKVLVEKAVKMQLPVCNAEKESIYSHKPSQRAVAC
jgi:hypothetical protein